MCMSRRDAKEAGCKVAEGLLAGRLGDGVVGSKLTVLQEARGVSGEGHLPGNVE